MSRPKGTHAERVEARNRKYDGFGDSRSAASWARTAGVPLTSFHRYLKEGMTVEQIFELRGATYEAENPKSTARKDRYGRRMKEAQEMAYTILSTSGYIINDGPECIGVRKIDNNANLAITFHGRPFGAYNYRSGGLTLSGGEGIPMKEVSIYDAWVLRNGRGQWEPHPETRKIMWKLFYEKMAKKQTGEKGTPKAMRGTR